MRTKSDRETLYIFLILIMPLLASCVGDIREKLNENMKDAQGMFADQEFKKAIAHIELHKLRNGTYPRSLDELQFLSAIDSTMLRVVEYHKLDSGYELNIHFKFPTLTDGQETRARLSYPPEFWKGLGCVRSNAK